MRERERQMVTQWPGLDELLQRRTDGWNLIALEWERESASRTAAPPQNAVQIPYGLRVSDDGFHLEDEPSERRVLMRLLHAIVEDRPLSQAATELNNAGFSDRLGNDWTPTSVFELLPRLIEAGPSIFSSSEWVAQRTKPARSA